MRKLFLFIMIVFLSGCESINENPQNNCEGNKKIGLVCVDITPPEFQHVADMEITLGERFIALEGVTAIDDTVGDITDRITVEESVDTSEVGLYLVKYFVKDDNDNETIVIRYIKVVNEEIAFGSNMILNGDISDGFSGFTIYENEAGWLDVDYSNNELEVVVTTTDESHSWEPRIDYSGLTIKKGSTYEVSFDIKALRNREVKVLVGELLTHEPWFINFYDSHTGFYPVTTDYQTITFTFTMNKDTSVNGGILFEFGRLGSENQDTTIFIDNIVLKEIIGE